MCVSVCICLCARCIQVRPPNSASFLAALAMFHLCTFRIPCKHENGRAGRRYKWNNDKVRKAMKMVLGVVLPDGSVVCLECALTSLKS